MQHNLYIGTYTFKGGEGIYRFAVSEDGFAFQGGEMAQNPSYLCLSPNKKYLYAACEVSQLDGVQGGGVRAYEVQPDGSLRFINQQSTVGRGSCHVSVSPEGKWLFVANYGEGSASVLPLNEDGSIGTIARHILHKGHGPNEKRQERPHVHFCKVTPDGKYLAICDLGLDGVFLYPFSEEEGVLDPCQKLSVPAGDGPRHLIFSKCGKYLYLLTEMGANVIVFERQEEGYACVQIVPTLPADYEGMKWGAAIRLSQDGRFLITSNRAHDSLTVFAVEENGKLRQVQNIPSGGKTPRDFDFSPDGKLVVVAHQDGGGLRLFKFCQASGLLTDTGLTAEAAIPVGVCFG